MRRNGSLVLIAFTAASTAVLFGATPSLAHHSFTATYFEDREITIEGDIAAFMFRNPHAFIQVTAPDDKGQMQRWAIEWGGASALSGSVSRDTLKPGDHVVVRGNPGREASDYRIRLRHIARPADGWEWGGTFE